MRSLKSYTSNYRNLSIQWSSYQVTKFIWNKKSSSVVLNLYGGHRLIRPITSEKLLNKFKEPSFLKKGSTQVSSYKIVCNTSRVSQKSKDIDQTLDSTLSGPGLKILLSFNRNSVIIVFHLN